MTLKLLFDPATGRMLGAQAVGGAGVDKRIDVLAIAIQAGMTVFDLEEMELAYAPQYGSAKDPINMAGFVAAAVARGEHPQVDVEVLESGQSEQRDATLLDVRTPGSLTRGRSPVRSTSRSTSCGRGSTSCPAIARSSSTARSGSGATSRRACSGRWASTRRTSRADTARFGWFTTASRPRTPRAADWLRTSPAQPRPRTAVRPILSMDHDGGPQLVQPPVAAVRTPCPICPRCPQRLIQNEQSGAGTGRVEKSLKLMPDNGFKTGPRESSSPKP